MNGPEAVSILRDCLKYSGVIIGITGNALPADISTFLESGADEVLIKPLTRKKLLDALQSQRTIV
jgi:CheY-like chemotaxis protein